jgi:hypothetical protein
MLVIARMLGYSMLILTMSLAMLMLMSVHESVIKQIKKLRDCRGRPYPLVKDNILINCVSNFFRENSVMDYR